VLCPARDPSLRSEPALERSEGMTAVLKLMPMGQICLSPIKIILMLAGHYEVNKLIQNLAVLRGGEVG